jgi:hypothetical protein
MKYVVNQIDISKKDVEMHTASAEPVGQYRVSTRIWGSAQLIFKDVSWILIKIPDFVRVAGNLLFSNRVNIETNNLSLKFNA